MKHTKYDLAQMQSVPLEGKILMTQRRIREWVDEFGSDGVYVLFSGGKDSTVLLHIVREMYPDIEAVFVNTGLEYPEIQQFVKTFDNVTILRPKMRFDEVIKKYGYPIISKEVSNTVSNLKRNGQKEWIKRRVTNGFCNSKYLCLANCDFFCSDQCCSIMKKKPSKEFQRVSGKKQITAQMASESRLRYTAWLRNGCNGFDMKSPISNPMSFWTEQDIYQYIKEYNLPICSVYGDIVYTDSPDQMRLEDYGIECGTESLCTTGCDRTGCIFCAFGAHLEKSPTRFERLKETHPRQYQYCIGGGEYVDGVWQPSREGLGMGHVFDELNKLYGDEFIKY